MTARGRAGSGGATLSLVVFDVARWDRKARASRFTVRVKGPLTKRQADTASWKPMTLTAVRGTLIGTLTNCHRVRRIALPVVPGDVVESPGSNGTIHFSSKRWTVKNA